MASAIAVLKKLDSHMGPSTPGGVLLEGVVGGGSSYLMGRAFHRYQTKWWGRNLPRIVGIAGKGLAALMAAYTKGAGLGVVNAVGQSGVNAVFLEMGLRHERAKTGFKTALVPKDFDLKKIPGASEATSMGALGKAQPGRGLSWDQIEELAAGR